jgi:hypothetical protein
VLPLSSVDCIINMCGLIYGRDSGPALLLLRSPARGLRPVRPSAIVDSISFHLKRDRIMSIAARGLSSFVLFSALLGPIGSAAATDIQAKITFHAATGSAIYSSYTVELKNIGPDIQLPYQARFWLNFPVGIKVHSSILNGGFQCTPNLPADGNVTLTCSSNWPAIWVTNTIISNQVFYVTFEKKGAKPPGPVCVVRSQVLQPNPSGVYQPLAETDTKNNAACVN